MPSPPAATLDRLLEQLQLATEQRADLYERTDRYVRRIIQMMDKQSLPVPRRVLIRALRRMYDPLIVLCVRGITISGPEAEQLCEEARKDTFVMLQAETDCPRARAGLELIWQHLHPYRAETYEDFGRVVFQSLHTRNAELPSPFPTAYQIQSLWPDPDAIRERTLVCAGRQLSLSPGQVLDAMHCWATLESLHQLACHPGAVDRRSLETGDVAIETWRTNLFYLCFYYLAVEFRDDDVLLRHTSDNFLVDAFSIMLEPTRFDPKTDHLSVMDYPARGFLLSPEAAMRVPREALEEQGAKLVRSLRESMGMPNQAVPEH